MCFIYIGNAPMITCRWNLARYIAYCRADLERFLFLISCTPRAIWILCMTVCATFRLRQAPRIILERYRPCYNVAFCSTLCLLRILLSFYTQSIHFRSNPNKFGHDIVVLVFQKARNFFICERNTIRVVTRVIACVKSIYITFYDVVHIVAFYVIYKTVGVGVHNFAFFAKKRCHVITCGEIRTNTSWIC